MAIVQPYVRATGSGLETDISPMPAIGHMTCRPELGAATSALGWRRPLTPAAFGLFKEPLSNLLNRPHLDANRLTGT
jgi:hypothetical protein